MINYSSNFYTKYFSYGVIGLYLWSALVVGVSFRNAENYQNDYEIHIARSIADDIASVRAQHPKAKYTAYGRADYDPVTQHYMDNNPLIGLLVPNYLVGEYNNFWLTMDHYGVSHDYFMFDWSYTVDCSAEVVRRAKSYYIYYKQDHIFVDFSHGNFCLHT
jgi:hypothetical protein